MGDALVEFTQNQLESIGKYIQVHINEWIPGPTLERFEKQRERELDQRDRIIRLEESQKYLQEQIKDGFEMMEKRFDDQRQDMLSRFDAVDKRFDEQRKDMLSRFDAVDKRFDEQRKDMLSRFDDQRQDILHRFEKTDQRFNRLFALGASLFITMIGGFISLIIKLY